MYHDTYVILISDKYIHTYTHIQHYEDSVLSSTVSFAVGVS